MEKLSDCHMHSNHSGDSTAQMEDMIKKAISLNLSTICFTEHNDFDFPDSEECPGSAFILDTEDYKKEFISLQKKYGDKIKLLFGLELGLMESVKEKNEVLAKSCDFDFIIGSTHLVNGLDPYYPAFFQNKTDEDAYREYFQVTLKNIKSFSDFDTYGHLDYIVRYGKTKDLNYSYEKYKDVIDPILKELIFKGKGLELNTCGLRKGMRDFNPCIEVLKRYRELGGEIITLGSDAHCPEDIAHSFSLVRNKLTDSGFKYYTIFEKRKPTFIKF